mmetsp:Transcript_29612/g.56920  ORF Transcript_29612/g.56920 Transcript_29612/m.56920 type:complete len:234 (+) Transcript_29612:722-1423(+)
MDCTSALALARACSMEAADTAIGSPASAFLPPALLLIEGPEASSGSCSTSMYRRGFCLRIRRIYSSRYTASLARRSCTRSTCSLASASAASTSFRSTMDLIFCTRRRFLKYSPSSLRPALRSLRTASRSSSRSMFTSLRSATISLMDISMSFSSFCRFRNTSRCMFSCMRSKSASSLRSLTRLRNSFRSACASIVAAFRTWNMRTASRDFSSSLIARIIFFSSAKGIDSCDIL